MEDYLTGTTSKLRSKAYSSVTAVLGNESCDLDSAVSSLVYAMFLHWQYQKIRCGVCTRTSNDVKHEVFLPILDVDREDYELKTEVAHCFDEAGIKKEHLIFRNDLNLQELVQSVKTTVVLVDHHNMSAKFEFLAPYVSEIIDHRPLDKSVWKYKDDTRSTIEVVGSCCTLVAQRIKDLSALLRKDTTFFSDHPICADLLHSCIILDTVNFSKEVNKATQLDADMTMFLESILKPKDYEMERRSKLERLVAARGAVSELSAAQLLRKDVKVLGDVLVPSFPVLVQEFLSKPNAMSALAEALEQRQCSVALLLGMRLDRGLQRDVAVYAPRDPELADMLVRDLQEWSRPALQLQPGNPEVGCVHFNQLNLGASRKQIMPVITKFLGQR